jgi:thioredoxin 1
VNVDEEVVLASEYKIFSIPTILVIKNGEVVNKSVGAKPKAQLLAML